MQLGDRPETCESQLIGSRVLDRHNYLLGKVHAVRGVPEHQPALVVKFPTSLNELDDLVIESHHITAIDPGEKVIQTDLDFNLVVPEKGKTIPLVQEKVLISHHRRKLGEVVVRKVTETDWVQVPVRREKLVVQREGKAEPLMEIGLGETRVSPERAIAPTTPPPTPETESRLQFETVGYWQSLDAALQALRTLATHRETAGTAISIILFLTGSDPAEQIRLQFASPKTAIRFLASIASGWWHQCQGIRIEHVS